MSERTSLSRQIAADLRTAILGGTLAPGAVLPSERELIARYSTRDVLELRFAIGEQRTAEDKVRAAGVDRIEALPDRLLWYADDGEYALATAHRLGLAPVTALVRRSTLEDVFLALTGRTLVD